MLTKISMPYTTYIHYVFNVCRSYTLPQQSFTVILHMLVKSTRFLIDIISFQKILTDFLIFYCLKDISHKLYGKGAGKSE